MQPSDTGHRSWPAEHKIRALLLLAACLLIAGLLSSDKIFGLLERLLAAAEPTITAHPVAGALLFLLLSALSAMLAFFSSAVLVPLAVLSWGVSGTILLLWAGWILGGLAAYTLGRALGRPIIRSLASARWAIELGDRLSARAPFAIIFLLQLALPSEIPGYLFGLARVRLGVYLLALALAEVPFAIGTVLLGESIVERRVLLLVALGAGGVVLGLVAMRLLRAWLRGPPRKPA